MNRKFFALTALMAGGLYSHATIYFQDDFNSYTDGNLVGQGTWVQTGSSATTPIQVTGGKAVLGTSGQDINAPLTTALNWTEATPFTFNIGATINVSSAQTGGDYFMNWSPSSGSTTYISRIYAKSDGAGGFLLGYLETANGSLTYGTQSLNFGQNYNMVVKYDAVPGALNDTAQMFVDNTLYLEDTAWGSTLPETLTFGAINLRQGSASLAAALSVDNLYVEVVPEPASLSILGLGMAAMLIARRRK